jgi:hypothetical protein
VRRISLRRLPVVAATVMLSAAGLVSAGSTAVGASAEYHSVFHAARQAHGVRNIGWSSSNWSGYAKSGSYTRATATWVVSSVSSTKRASYSSAWVGIDGFTNSSLIQTGTESDYYSGAAHYNAWWEILPAAETPISSFAVHPGDVMTASITKGSGSSWSITISDSRGGSFTTTQSYSGPGASVEWIEEAPEVNGRIATLAHYSSPDKFDPGTANGVSPGLASSDGGAMVQNGAQVSTPSVPDSEGDGFNISYGSAAPAPPSS